MLFDVGPNYLVMELVEGPTLAELMAKGRLPVPEALRIAGQIADALEPAHAKHIVSPARCSALALSAPAASTAARIS